MDMLRSIIRKNEKISYDVTNQTHIEKRSWQTCPSKMKAFNTPLFCWLILAAGSFAECCLPLFGLHGICAHGDHSDSWFCGVGKCNMFGCNCDGGCKKGSLEQCTAGCRRLFDAWRGRLCEQTCTDYIAHQKATPKRQYIAAA